MIKWIFTVFISIAVVITLLFVYFIFLPMNEYAEEQSNEAYSEHIQIIAKDSGEYFWDSFQQGAFAAGLDSGVYVELVSQSAITDAELKRLLETGAYSRVQGIALQPLDLASTQSVVDEISAQGVKIVTYESGNKLLVGVPTVGSNYFGTGRLAGQMAKEAAGERAKAVVLLNNNEMDGDNQQQSSMIQGIMDGTADAGAFEITEIITILPDRFEAENVTRELLESAEPPDVIICMDEKSTPAVAQALLDNGGVGRVRVVGYGVMPQTLDYIKRGVIFGSVAPDAYETGYKTVELLNEMILGKQVSDYTNPTLHRVDQSNVDGYIGRQYEE